MSDPEGAKFLFRMAKSARKHWCGLTVVTQDAGDLLGSPLGQAVVANAATQILLRQAPQTIDALGEAFGLSAGERAYLLGARRGEGLLAAGTDRVAFACVASPAEHRLVTSDPAELRPTSPIFEPPPSNRKPHSLPPPLVTSRRFPPTTRRATSTTISSLCRGRRSSAPRTPAMRRRASVIPIATLVSSCMVCGRRTTTDRTRRIALQRNR